MGIKETLSGALQLFRRSEPQTSLPPSPSRMRISVPADARTAVVQSGLDYQGNPIDRPLGLAGAPSGVGVEAAALEQLIRLEGMKVQILIQATNGEIDPAIEQHSLALIAESQQKFQALSNHGAQIRQEGGGYTNEEKAQLDKENARRGQLKAYRDRHTISSEKDAEKKGIEAIKAFLVKQKYPFMR